MSLSHKSDVRDMKKPSAECGVRVSQTVVNIEKLLVAMNSESMGPVLALLPVIRDLIMFKEAGPNHHSVDRVNFLVNAIERRLEMFAKSAPMTWPATAREVRDVCKTIDKEVSNW